MKSSRPIKPELKRTWDVIRTIRIPALVSTADCVEVERALHSESGVRGVATDASKCQVIVIYDANQTAYRTIIEALHRSGFPPPENYWNRIKQNWYEFVDTNAKANTPPSGCCNRPQK
jgi:hypothetical protein